MTTQSSSQATQPWKTEAAGSAKRMSSVARRQTDCKIRIATATSSRDKPGQAHKNIGVRNRSQNQLRQRLSPETVCCAIVQEIHVANGVLQRRTRRHRAIRQMCVDTTYLAHSMR